FRSKTCPQCPLWPRVCSTNTEPKSPLGGCNEKTYTISMDSWCTRDGAGLRPALCAAVRHQVPQLAIIAAATAGSRPGTTARESERQRLPGPIVRQDPDFHRDDREIGQQVCSSGCQRQDL